MLTNFSIFNTIYNDAPQPWQLGFQDSASPSFTGIVELHNTIFFFLVVIAVGIFWVLGSTIYYYSSKNSPIVHKYLNHGTLIELIWTITPALILIVIAFPSFRLLYLLDEVVSPTITIKVVGHQWYWSYEYSDYVNESGESIEFDSYMIPDSDLEIGQFRVLEVDNKVIVPVDTHVRIIVTGADVIHSFTVPSLGIKIDTVPGRLNQTSLLAERTVTFYGQCSEICGIYHGFMPIAIESVSVQDYLTWVNDLSLNSLSLILGPTCAGSANINKLNKSLSPYWITGLTDAEGSFIISIYKRSDSNQWQISPSFELWFHSKDISTLQELRDYFGVGIINTRKNKNVTSFTVTKTSDLINVIIPHFSNFPLQTQKRIDFELWAKIVEIKSNNEHLTHEGLLKILSLKSALNKGLSKSVSEIKNIEILERPLHLAEFNNIDPNWISGFVAGDGTFDIKITKRKSK